MTYYFQIKDDVIIGKGECKLLNSDIQNIEVEKSIYDEIEKYIYKNGEIILNPDFEAEQAEKEKQAQIDKIKTELEEIDRQGQRSARAISLLAASFFNPPLTPMIMDEGQTIADAPQTNVLAFNPEDVEKLTELENQAKILRAELKELEGENNENG